MSSNSVAILVSNDPMPTNADGLMDFNQNADLLYLRDEKTINTTS